MVSNKRPTPHIDFQFSICIVHRSIVIEMEAIISTPAYWVVFLLSPALQPHSRMDPELGFGGHNP